MIQKSEFGHCRRLKFEPGVADAESRPKDNASSGSPKCIILGDGTLQHLCEHRCDAGGSQSLGCQHGQSRLLNYEVYEMITVRRADDRGKTKLDWLLSCHSFSFGTYHDPAHAGFRTLRVLNEDRVAPEGGFATHPHRDMEIISYVLEGTLEHKDSLGNQGLVKTGEIQLMTAGSGLTHSEFNPSETDHLHFLQIWILPNQKGLPPGYQKKFFYERERINQFKLVASPDKTKNVLFIHQNVEMYIGNVKAGHAIEHSIPKQSGAWIQVVRGDLLFGEIRLKKGDGVGLEKEEMISLTAESDSEVLLFVLQDA